MSYCPFCGKRKGLNMKRKILIISIILAMLLTGCRGSRKGSHNVSKEADNFNVIRRLTVLKCKNR